MFVDSKQRLKKSFNSEEIKYILTWINIEISAINEISNGNPVYLKYGKSELTESRVSNRNSVSRKCAQLKDSQLHASKMH